mgnify:CR=1 FL=1
MKYAIRYLFLLHILVAPFAGAWIEIELEQVFEQIDLSLPSRERGLKFRLKLKNIILLTSLPSRERGLKSHSQWNTERVSLSLPSRERGLKFPVLFDEEISDSRSLRGSVD